MYSARTRNRLPPLTQGDRKNQRNPRTDHQKSRKKTSCIILNTKSKDTEGKLKG